MKLLTVFKRTKPIESEAQMVRKSRVAATAFLGFGPQRNWKISWSPCSVFFYCIAVLTFSFSTTSSPSDLGPKTYLPWKTVWVRLWWRGLASPTRWFGWRGCHSWSCCRPGLTASAAGKWPWTSCGCCSTGRRLIAWRNFKDKVYFFT